MRSGGKKDILCGKHYEIRKYTKYKNSMQECWEGREDRVQIRLQGGLKSREKEAFLGSCAE